MSVYILYRKDSEWHKFMGGVYKITFGHKYYIGKTKFLHHRRNAHEKHINHILSGYIEDFRYSNNNMYYYIVRHLQENPSIRIGYIEMVQCCHNSKQMDYCEGKILYNLLNNEDCLNYGKHKPPLTRSPMTILPSCNIYEYYRWFYNPSIDCEVMEIDDISTSGFPRRLNRSLPYDTEKWYILQSLCSKFGNVS